MSVTNEVTELLDLPLHAVSTLRSTSAAAGIDPPGWLVQLVVFLTSIVLLWYFSRQMMAWRTLPSRAVAAVAGITSFSVVVAILWTLFEQWHWPPTGQIRGTVSGVPVDKAEIQLLDVFGKPMGQSFADSKSKLFAVSYSPVYAEPPRELLVRATGCTDIRIPLGRRHLQFGAPISAHLTCGVVE